MSVGGVLAAAGPGGAETLTQAWPLHNGVNYVDFTGDGVEDAVVIGHRANFNAHGFDVVSFFASVKVEESAKAQWHVVPLLDEGQEIFQVRAAGGADCLLHDFRLLPGSRMLIVAHRDFGEGFAESRTVTFTYFEITKNEDGMPGSPVFRFEPKSSSRSKIGYCDVGEAFIKELGIVMRVPAVR